MSPGQSQKRPIVQELIQRATGGIKFHRHILFHPSLAYQILQDPFWVWCQYHAPKTEAVDEISRYDEMRMRRGIKHEEEWIQRHYPEAIEIKPAFGYPALRNTFKAMLEGAAAIYQPQLWDLAGETYGKADLLVRDDSCDSDLGPYHYRLFEIKRSKSLKEYHVLQAAFYNRMLGYIQGHTADELTVVLKDAQQRISYNGRENQLEDTLSKWKSLRNGSWLPEPRRPPAAAASPWRLYGNHLVEERKDLLLLAGIGSREREKLRRAGIHRVDQLWDLPLEKTSKVLGEKYGTTAHYVAQAYRSAAPVAKPGRRLNIPRARRLLYFDFETSDDMHPTEPPHVYLIGCWDGKRDQFVKFLARGAEDEERIFTEFLDFVGGTDNVKLYHWTDFEVGQMRKVMQRWPSLEGPLQRLISSCVDLKQAIQFALYLPVPTFSIKCVAPALGFHWRQEGFGAFESMVLYWDYLEGKGGSDIEKVVLYNEDDCVAMWHVDQELMKRLGNC